MQPRQPQSLMRRACERPGQRSAASVRDKGRQGASPLRATMHSRWHAMVLEEPLPAAPDATRTHRRAVRQKSAKRSRGATRRELAKYLRPAASRRTEPEHKRHETKSGRRPHLRALAAALPLLSGKRWKGETKYPYLAALRRAAYVYVCEASRQAPARTRF
jgi:hypothetical protein